MTAAVLAVAVPAEAATSTSVADRHNSSQLSPNARQAAGAADAILATTDEIRAMAAADGNNVLTFSVKRSGQALVQKVITCYPSFTSPYGPNTAGSSVRVDAYVYCDDWVHSISLRPQIYRSNSLVASALYAIAYSNFVAGSVSTSCLPASYFSAITAVISRYDATPPSLLVNLRSLDVSFSCGGAPPPPPPPAGVTVTNPGTQANYKWDSVSLQLHASGGTGTYTWSASGLPPEAILNNLDRPDHRHSSDARDILGDGHGDLRRSVGECQLHLVCAGRALPALLALLPRLVGLRRPRPPQPPLRYLRAGGGGRLILRRAGCTAIAAKLSTVNQTG